MYIMICSSCYPRFIERERERERENESIGKIDSRIGSLHYVIRKLEEGVVVLISLKWEGEIMRDSVLISNHIND